MQRVATTATPVKHYAVYHRADTDLYGTCELLVGYGWLFRSDDTSWLELCTLHDVQRGTVELHGLVTLADAQHATDLATREADMQARRCADCGLVGCLGAATCEATTNQLSLFA